MLIPKDGRSGTRWEGGKKALWARSFLSPTRVVVCNQIATRTPR
jgi:hypothetical protein